MKSLLYKSHVVSVEDLSSDQVMQVLTLAKYIKEHGPIPCLEGKIIATCFYEPSTRTRLSFESAALRMGAKVIGFADANTSSHKKGESLHDSMKVMSCYADAIVLRHPKEGSARWVSEVVNVPLINAGDGKNQHPTQALLDLFTIKECHPGDKPLNVVFMGDLRHGRTVSSLARACGVLNSRLYFVADDSLSLPEHLSEILKRQAIRFSFHRSLDEVIEHADILYVTRLQKERAQAGVEHAHYSLGIKDLARAKPTLRVMHPLPRVDEIDPQVDETEHAYYFQQAENGLYARQALLALLLNEELAVGDLS